MVAVNKKIAILFAGQGAQSPGMGKNLYECSPAARKIIDSAGSELKSLLYEGSQNDLNDTLVTQPAVYAVDMAAWEAFKEKIDETSLSETTRSVDITGAGKANITEGVKACITGMAGFSLGEYAAMTAAGIISTFEEGLELVRRRSSFMAEAGRYKDGNPRGAMAAVMGKHDEIIEILEKSQGDHVLEGVNFNSPSQIVIAGDAKGIDAYILNVKASKKRLKVKPLPVSSAFHTSIMEPASKRIKSKASEIGFGKAKYDLCLNHTGRFMKASDGDIHVIMSRQIKNPVYWQKSLETLRDAGTKIFIELGPGKTLSGFVKKTIPGAEFHNIEDEESLNNTIDALTGS